MPTASVRCLLRSLSLAFVPAMLVAPTGCGDAENEHAAVAGNRGGGAGAAGTPASNGGGEIVAGSGGASQGGMAASAGKGGTSGEGGVATGGTSQAGGGNGGVDAARGGTVSVLACTFATCVHALCSYGVPLSSVCSPCVKAVCEQMPSCCASNWSSACGEAANARCGCACSSGAGGAGGRGALGGSGGMAASGGASSSGAGGGSAGGGGAAGARPSSCTPHPAGTSTVAAPVLSLTLFERWEEAWLGSPAVADLDGDGRQEIVVPRGGALIVWNADGTLRWKFSSTPGRIWSSPVVADFRDDTRLEIAFASRNQIFMLNAGGELLSGFPVTWEDEMRSLAAGDVDGDGRLDLVAAPGHGSPSDVMNGWHADGTPVAGFPPNQAGVSGCNHDCYLAGCYDQNVALGDLDGDGKQDVVVPHDNAYASFHRGSGEAFDANPRFQGRSKTPGVRYLHDLALAEQGYADDEATALQAHFTNTAPAIADVDGDGRNEIVMLGSVQNAAQTDRLRGVGLWVVRNDASRIPGWETPFHVPAYLAGLWDYEGVNVVAATNQVAIADIDPAHAGPEFVFAGFDGKIHAVSADRNELWSTAYTTDPNVLTGGVVLGDLSGDGVPEIVFNSYSVDNDKGALFVLDAAGRQLHRLPLPRRGAMPVPTLADVDGNGTVEIVVSLKDAEDRVQSVLVYTVPSSFADCLPWPTGRANLLRDGWVRTK